MEESKFKYESVMQYVQRFIDENGSGKSDKLPTEEQIARTLNLSRATVQRALKKLEQEGMIYRIQGSGTFIRSPSDSKGGSQMIPMVLCHHFNQLHGFDIIRGAQNYLMNHACHLSPYFMTSPHIQEYETIIDSLVDSGLRSIMVMVPDTSYDKEYYFRLIRQGIHIVFLDVPPCYEKRVNLVTSNHEQGGWLATEHLIELGHTRIGMLCPHFLNVPYLATLSHRVRGYVSAMQQHGLPLEKSLMRFCQDEDCIPAVTREIMSLPDPPTALFVLNDRAAQEAISELRRMGLRVPEDVSVVGFDNLDVPSRPTTIRQDFYRIGYHSAQMALDLLHEQRPILKNLYLPVELLARDTTAAPPQRILSVV